MGKKYTSEVKIVKQRAKYRKKNRSVKKKRIYEIKSKINENSIQFSITSLINSLDDGVKPSIKEKFKLKFGSNISNTEFINLFKIGIVCAKNKFKLKNLKFLKKLLIYLKTIDINSGYIKDENNFEFLSSNNKLEIIYKKDFVLHLLSSEMHIESFNFSNVNGVENEFSKTIEYYIYSNKTIFENSIEYNKNISKDYSLAKFEKLLFSKTIINTYIEVFKDLYNKTLSEKELINGVSNFKNNHKIFIIDMGFKFYGLLLYDGTILVNKRYYFQNQNIETMIFIIFSTLLHEYMHSLSRIFRGDDNFFYDTDEFLKYKRITPKESGDYFENKIFFEALPDRKITSLEAAYLLDPNNYTYDSSEKFKNAFAKYKAANFKKIKNLPSQAISKEASDYNSIDIKYGCLSSIIRRNKKNN